MRQRSAWVIAKRMLLVFACAVFISVQAGRAQRGAAAGEWRHYGGDAAGTKYSPLDQINASNVNRLQIAWRWKTANLGQSPDYNWQATPLMIGDTLYFTAGSQRSAVAIDAASGDTKWTYTHDEGDRGRRAVRTNNRGLAYWSDAAGNGRVLLITPGYQLLALDAKTGKPIPTFGNAGVVELWDGLDRKVEINQIGSSSPAMIVGDVAVVGAAMLGGTAPATMKQVPGYIRGYDVRTGKLLWTFHTIPQGTEFGVETWQEESWKYTGNTAVWAPMSADLDLGYVYLPVETPTGDYYGGHRPGDNLFGDSVVCLDAKTGKRIWHFQLSLSMDAREKSWLR
jgi:quinoprotein glucose dehydrogenase